MLLHIGCGKKLYPKMINLRHEDFNIATPWQYADESIDGIISMQVLQQLQWRDLLFALKEMYRVLKQGGIMRFGTMLVEDNDPERALGWNNINLFSFDILNIVLRKVGFSDVRIAEYQDCEIEEFKQVDDRHINRGTTYIEARK